jgi:hypothetical protein
VSTTWVQLIFRAKGGSPRTPTRNSKSAALLSRSGLEALRFC